MKELIGVTSLDRVIVEDLKRYFLIFDKLYIVGVNEWLFEVHNKDAERKARPFIDQMIYMFWKDLSNREIGEYQKYLTNELHLLIEQGKIILDDREIAPRYDGSDYFTPVRENSHRLSDYAFKYVDKYKENSVKFDFLEYISLFHELSVRNSSLWMNLNKDTEVYPLIEKFTPIKELETKKQVVFRNTLNKILLPSASSSWENIFEFKNDKDSYGSLLGLKNFVNEVSNSNLNLSEIEEKIEYLLYKYEKALELHKIKTSVSTLEILIVGGAELIEDIAKLKLGKIAKGLFNIGKHQMDLLEVELKSEGSELSYITKVNKKFNQDKEDYDE
jgi:hypothetical protein